MALFKRKKNAVVLPEMDWYNKVEKKERSGLALPLAVASVAAAVLVIIGLFFGGRWLYRHGKANNKPATTQVETKPTSVTSSGDAHVDAPGPSTSTTTPSSTPSSTPASTPAASAAAQTNLANTGPANTISIFLGVTLLSVIVYQFKLRRI